MPSHLVCRVLPQSDYVLYIVSVLYEFEKMEGEKIAQGPDQQFARGGLTWFTVDSCASNWYYTTVLCSIRQCVWNGDTVLTWIGYQQTYTYTYSVIAHTLHCIVSYSHWE